MAALRVMCAVSILQMILSLVTLGMCSTQYYTANYTETIIPNATVYFLLRALPLINLLVCGAVGTVSSCLNNNASRAIYSTLTIQTSLSLTALVWYFSYWVGHVQTEKDKENAIKCLSTTVLSLTISIGYLIYELSNYLSSRINSSNEKLNERRRLDVGPGLHTGTKTQIAVVMP